MPSTDYGRKLTPAEQTAAAAAAANAPKDRWLITGKPLYPPARKQSSKPLAAAPADPRGSPA
jgi:hypothetical protein